MVGANFPLGQFWWEPISLWVGFGGSQFTSALKLCSIGGGCRGWPAQSVKLSIRRGEADGCALLRICRKWDKGKEGHF